MLIKEKDSQESAIQQLESIIKISNLSRYTLEQAQKELWTLKAGLSDENNAAYFINFDYAPSKNYAVIHDLRIEHQNRVEQIDHLLISRTLEFYVLESKSFIQGIKITDRGEFHVEYNGNYKAIESPIEQNRRHAEVLRKLLSDAHILPTRLGIKLQPKIISYVLVSPNSLAKRPAKKSFDTYMVIKADELTRAIDTRNEKMDTLGVMENLAHMVSSETLEQIARGLVAMHKPSSINYYEKFGINPDVPNISTTYQTTPIKEISSNKPSLPEKYCFKCRKGISKEEAKFCFDRKQRFGGRAYCRECQKSF